MICMALLIVLCSACGTSESIGNPSENTTGLNVEVSDGEKSHDMGLWSGAYNPDLTLEMLGYDDLSADEVENLYVLCKVWGFLKYYHPNVRAGNFDWDMELMGILESYSKVGSKEERDQLMLLWLKALGPYEDEVVSTIEPDDELALLPDFTWIESLDDEDLKSELNKIIQVKRGREQYYADYTDINGYLSKNEKRFVDETSSSVGIRLLTLFRYWNIYNYYSPYIEITDKPWDDVLKEMIPPFVLDDNGDSFVDNLRKLVAYTGDEHTYYRGRYADGDSLFGKYHLPLKVRYFDDELVLVDSYSMDKSLDEMGLVPGDILTHIDGKPVEEVYDSMDPYVPTSYEGRNRLYLWDIYLFRTHHINMTLTLVRDGGTMEVKINTFTFGEGILTRYYNSMALSNRSKTFEDLGNGLLYLNLDNLTERDIETHKEEIMASEAMIWDLRNYPDYDMYFSLLSLVLDEPKQGAMFTVNYPPNPGTFMKNNYVPYFQPNTDPYGGMIVGLIDEYSKSRPEYLAMFFDVMPNSVLIGRSTAGADGDVSNAELPLGVDVFFTGLGVYYPDGTETQRVGIIPDIEVVVTKEGVLAGRDEVLEKAVDYINGK